MDAGDGLAYASGGHLVTSKKAALSGMAGPILFGSLTLVATLLQTDFMKELGWDVYPSGLALGPYGWIQVANFALLGILIVAFGLGLYRAMGSKIGKSTASLAILAGVGALLLTWKTDPPRVQATTHGQIHLVGYLVLVLSLLVSYCLTALHRGAGVFSGYKRYFLVGVGLAILGFAEVLPQPWGNFVFIMGVLAPLEVMAIALWRASAES
jgi:hypothetical protein